ncbi:MAG: putative 2OG-Fe(II) oxygenase [Enterobacterales bacterium]|nr:putative 2OG-Fe(II) oxygenase [Enterobacterales bacterium]
MAFVYQNLGDRKLALQYYEQALNLDANHILSLQNSAILLKEIGLNMKAIALLKRAMRINPNIPEVLQNLATNQASLGFTEESIINFRKAIALEPLNPSHHHWLNLLLWSIKEESFLASYKSVLDKFPNAFLIKRELAYKLILADRKVEAELILLELVKKEPNNSLNFKLLGNVSRKLRKFNCAIDYHLKALCLESNNLSLKEELATSYFSAGLPQKAECILLDILKQNPIHQGALALKSLVLRVLEKDEYHELCDYKSLILYEKLNTPKGFESLDEFNLLLIKTLEPMHISKKHPLEQSLTGGTQSIGNLFLQSKKPLKILKNLLSDKFKEFISSFPVVANHPVYSRNSQQFKDGGSWSVRLNSSGYHRSHFHSHGWFSGPYYVSLPPQIQDTEAKEGWIKFGEPGIENVYNLEADYLLQPKEGYMARFPSYFWHGTTAFKSEQTRLVVTQDVIPF